MRGSFFVKTPLVFSPEKTAQRAEKEGESRRGELARSRGIHPLFRQACRRLWRSFASFRAKMSV